MVDQPATLVEALDSLQVSPARVVFPESGAVLPHRDLPARSRALARTLIDEDVRPGDVVGSLIPTAAEFLPAFFGVLSAGATISVLPMPPIVTDAVAAARRLLPVLERAQIRHVVVLGTGRAIGEALTNMKPGLRLIEAGHAIRQGAQGEPGLPGPRPEDLAVVQFTSGSTSSPRGVTLTHRAVLQGVTAINERIATRPQDVLVQWLPLFHDMGLVALLCSLLSPCDAHLFSPMAFIRRPVELVRHLASVKGTITVGPNFSYDKLASAAAGLSAAEGEGLGQWRLALNGGEMVQGHTLDSFDRVFTPHGVPRSTMYPCYGMAEAVLAVSLPSLGSVPQRLRIDRNEMIPGSPVITSQEAADGVELVSVGHPVAGMDLRIKDPEGRTLPEGHLGELCLRGPAVTTGYLHDPKATRQALRAGWLHTGDLGFLHQGQLYIAGRTKDMIVVRGHNYFPEDVERLVRRMPGVFRGHSVALADPQTEHILVVAESLFPPDSTEARSLVEGIRRAVSGELGLAAVRVLTVPPRFLPRTTSGKWQRSWVRDLVAQHAPGTAEPAAGPQPGTVREEHRT